MNMLVIGLGSMGKRRIRNLRALGMEKIAGVDPRADRREEAVSKYGITAFETFEAAHKADQYDAFIISVSPDKHHIYMKEALKMNRPFFVEASVVDDDMEMISTATETKHLVAAPSSTMYFHPAIKEIRKIVEEKNIGQVTNILYHSGQYLPDWHIYESPADFYVSSKATGGAREIVPFELTWIVKVFGLPKAVTGFYKKTIDIPGAPDIDDTYNGLFDYGAFILNLSVDVVSRIATRKLLINGSEGQLQWDWNDNFISLYTNGEWQKIHFEMLGAEQGYNKNITEQMYVDEMKAFVDAVHGKATFVNDLRSDHAVLKLLYALERSCDQGTIELI